MNKCKRFPFFIGFGNAYIDIFIEKQRKYEKINHFMKEVSRIVKLKTLFYDCKFH